MHFPLDSIPERAELGDLTAAYQRFPKGMDADKVLAGLPNNMCPCPHWGYALKGAMVLKYADGSREEIRAGDVFYIPPDHSAEFNEDFSSVEFSPKQEFWRVMAHVNRKLKEG